MTTAVTGSKLRFTDFVDLVLARLYELDQEGSGRFYDLNAINKQLKTPVPQQWIFDTGKVLQSRGFAQVLFAFGGRCQASITGEGRLYVEEDRGFVREYHRQPQAYVVTVSGSHNQVVVGGEQRDISQKISIEDTRRPAFDILDQIQKKLDSDTTVTPETKTDLLADVDAIRQQLKKREPNRPALAAFLESLSQVVSIAGEVANLVRMFNA